ncbi:MAG TPA: UvrD-helicase domain-containing protein [Rhodanobacteraceae bacterium]|jgi:exodeoxyribonuclease V beta subunit|nr:UvrD-helicase domain-containing protein [Rhodanobacteraceae bacterium]
MSAPRDALDLPLDGIRTVEANAGTGKTFTIAALYLRLILERGLEPEEIVVATFTRAATAELSERLRDWLAQAARALTGDEPERERAGESGELQVIRRIIAQARELAAQAGDAEPLDSLRQRIREACLAIDTAQISTLHGFCFRVLGEFGFDTGSSLRRPELIEDMRALDLEIVRDFWRRGTGDAASASLLADTWGDPGTLARQASDPRWEGRAIEVPRADFAALAAGFDAARARIGAWGAAERATFDAELQRCVSTPRTRTARMQAWDGVRAWASSPSLDAALDSFDGKAVESIGADKLEGLQPKGVRPQGTVFDDIAALADAHAAIVAARQHETDRASAELLCEARRFLEHERTRRLRERGLMGHDQAVRTLAAALTRSDAGRVIGAIQRRWKAALIDEFQDSDSAQWNVVRKLFGDTTLILVGDPKQAIYGFRGGDVFAWRNATASAAAGALALTTSYRSGTRLCAAVNALFGGQHAFIDTGYRDVAASERSRRCAVSRGGAALPGIECWSFSATELGQTDGKPAAKERARTALQQRTVRWIAAMLGSATLHHGNGKQEPLQPKHIAVLVNSNREAAALQAALAEAGVPAASNLRASVYASDEADDLALLLDALADPADADRARAAWASRLVGKSAGAIAATLAGNDGTPQRVAAEWATTVRRHGVLAWLHRLIADAAPRLLEQPGGARSVANYLQLAELLQEDHATGLSPAELASRLAQRRVEADGDNDADSARLRLDTDADAVTVSTVHAAKGLEYDIVILPYAGFAKDPSKHPKGVALHWYHDEDGRACVALGSGPVVADAAQRACSEALAEDVRKLYVAVTRARALCVLPWGRIGQAQHGALFHLLHGADAAMAPPTDGACAAALDELRQRDPAAIGVRAWSDIPAAERWQAPAPTTPASAPRQFTRTGMQRDWNVWSFSRLVRGSANTASADPLPGAGDASATDAHEEGAEADAGLGGARFGTAVHTVFERTDFTAWRDALDTPAAARVLIAASLRGQGLAHGEAALKRALPMVGDFVSAALNATLPCGVRLCDVEASDRKAEIEFHLTLAPARSTELFALLHRHGYQRSRSGVAAEALHGLLTGKIDLTFRHAGRFHIVDWKTNRCAPYDAAAMRAEIAAHDYDLQWLIYTLALHRWLRQRLRDYDYERDVGEVYYLFVRGMHDGRGVHADKPPRALIEALDALFSAPMEAAA